MDWDEYFKKEEEYQKKLCVTKEDVWGDMVNSDKRGMVVAKSYDTCPIFHDKVPYKSVTVVCEPKQERDVCYWLSYVHGGNNISNRKVLDDGRIALRSDYTCW